MGDEKAAYSLQCSEVWGGNDEVERAVTMPGLDAWVFSRPCGADSGGDIHYLSSCATGRITRLLLADVSGHGADVSALALRLRGLTRRFVNYVDQRKLAALINAEFSKLGQEGKFATALLATYWAPTGELEITCAGHPPPLLYRRATASWEFLSIDRTQDVGDLPLGVFEDGVFGSTKVRLDDGDVLMAYTDAFLEAKPTGGGQVGARGLLELARGLSADAGAGAPAALYREVVAHGGGGPLCDDATVLAIRRNSLSVPRGSVAMGLAATGRLIKEAVMTVFGKGGVALPEARKDNVLGAWWDGFNRRR